MISRQFATIVLGVCLFGGAAGAQSEREGDRSYAAGALEMIIERALPSPPPPPGVVRNPRPSFESQASELAGALFEDATYRVGKTIDPFFGPDLEPEQILDRDWTRVKDVEVAPYKAVCNIEIIGNDGKKRFGTAAFVGRRVLVTAGHCVFDKDEFGGDGWARAVRVIPARKNGSERGEPFGSAFCSHLAASEEWVVSGGRDLEHDIAWLILPSRLLHGRVDFHFGVRAAAADRLAGFILFSASYPDPQTLGYKMYRDHEGKDQIVSENLFHHFHDTLEGSSGCPLYLKSGRGYDIVGVHSHTPVGPFANDWNTAVRMTSENIAKTRLYNQQYP